MGVLELYHYYNTEVADVRTNNWLFISSPFPTAIISLAYLYFVLRCGPRYMKDKPPYSCRKFIQFYNIFQIVANALIVYHIFEVGWYQEYFPFCVKTDYSSNPKPYKIATIIWYTYILKLIDYVETGVFVLRKKNRQISFLHLYHHVSSSAMGWFITKYFAHGMSLVVPVINCAIHVVMYIYYLLASIGPNVQSHLQPIKPIITVAQMVQFVALIGISVQAFLPSCHGVKVQAVVLIVNLIINFILFYNFYKKTYSSKKTKAK